MRSFAMVLFAVWCVGPEAVGRAADAVTVPNCFLAADAEASVPAQEAGVLVKIFVRDGQLASKDEPLAQIDDVVPRMQHRIAESKLKVAHEQAANDIDVRYARAAYQVADAKLRRSTAANQKTPGSISEELVDEQTLDKEKFRLMIEKAQRDMTIAKHQEDVSLAERDAAQVYVERRKILAPFDGVVVKLSRWEGEWVNPGDVVVRLVRIDRLRVEGLLNSSDYLPSEIEGRPVRVVVNLARGLKETVLGKIVFASPLIQTGGVFQVRAEIENPQRDGRYVLGPGLGAEMTIQLK